MNEALKSLEAVAELLYSELRRLSNDRMLDDRAFKLINKAALDAIEVKAQIQAARGWNTK